MNEYFLVGFVVGVILALVQPSLFAAFRKRRTKDLVAPEPIENSLPTTGKNWVFERHPSGFLKYQLFDCNGIEPVFVASVARSNTNDTVGYWRTCFKNGANETSGHSFTFEQACEWVKDRTGVDGPNPVHLPK